MTMTKRGWIALLVLLGVPAAVQARTAFVQYGQAVYYGGRLDAGGRMTAAHRTLPLGTWVRVVHSRTGKSVLVRINDRGPFRDPRRIVDLSLPAARVLGIVREGVAPVRLEVVRLEGGRAAR